MCVSWLVCGVGGLAAGDVFGATGVYLGTAGAALDVFCVSLSPPYGTLHEGYFSLPQTDVRGHLTPYARVSFARRHSWCQLREGVAFTRNAA